jgi:hypothetical protein
MKYLYLSLSLALGIGAAIIAAALLRRPPVAVLMRSPAGSVTVTDLSAYWWNDDGAALELDEEMKAWEALSIQSLLDFERELEDEKED